MGFSPDMAGWQHPQPPCAKFAPATRLYCIHISYTAHTLITGIYKQQEELTGGPQNCDFSRDDVHCYHLKYQQVCSKWLIFERLSSKNLLLTFSKVHLAFSLSQTHLFQSKNTNLLPIGFIGQQGTKVYDALISSIYFLRFCTTKHQIQVVLQCQATEYLLYYMVSRYELFKDNLSAPKSRLRTHPCSAGQRRLCARTSSRSQSCVCSPRTMGHLTCQHYPQ